MTRDAAPRCMPGMTFSIPILAVLMTPQRRMRLMMLASQFGFAIVEDDYDHDYHFTNQPLLPLAAFDGEGYVIYVGSLSKLLSPSLRLGYISAPKRLIGRVAREITLVDRQGDPAMEPAIAEFIEAGDLHRHTRKMKRLYADRRQALAEALSQSFGDAADFTVPDGGLAFWVRFRDVPAGQLLAQAHAHRVHFQAPDAFASDGAAVDALRLGFASLDVAELQEAAQRLKAAYDAVRI